MRLLQGACAGLADRGEGLRQDVLERLSRGELLAQRGGAATELIAQQDGATAELVVRELAHVHPEVVDLVDDLPEPPDLCLVAVDEAEQLGEGAQFVTAR